MQLLWIVIPITFVLWMQTRSFYKMRCEKINQKLMMDVEIEISEEDLSDGDECHNAIEETFTMT